jgi:hypothetical protein
MSDGWETQTVQGARVLAQLPNKHPIVTEGAHCLLTMMSYSIVPLAPEPMLLGTNENGIIPRMFNSTLISASVDTPSTLDSHSTTNSEN